MLSHPRNARDSALEATIGAFGFLYFIFYALQPLVFHFPSTAEHIPGAVVVVGFGVGIALWYVDLIHHGALYVFQSDGERKEHKTSHVDCMFLLWTTTLPTIYFLFQGQMLLQIWYALTFTMVTIGDIWECQSYGKATKAAFRPESLQVTSFGLLALIPTIHAYAEPTSVPSHLAVAVAFGRLMIGGILGGALYILRPLERMEIVRDWRPSLHGARLIWTWCLVKFSKSVLEAAIDYLR